RYILRYNSPELQGNYLDCHAAYDQYGQKQNKNFLNKSGIDFSCMEYRCGCFGLNKFCVNFLLFQFPIFRHQVKPFGCLLFARMYV
uniref:Uncharacterized protein n=1 Tax=Ciona intestinalis TaxID=7719 RepID=H2XWJ7_CIOIN